MNDTLEVFKKLHTKYGSHKAVVDVLGVTYRTYKDWRERAAGIKGKTDSDNWLVITRYLQFILEYGPDKAA